MMNDQMPPNFIVPPVLVIPCSPCWTDVPVALSAGSRPISAAATSASSSAYANGGRLQRHIHPERQAVADDLTRPGPGMTHGRLGHDEPEHGSGEGQDESFGDDLRDHAGAARPQRVADEASPIRASPCARRSASRRSPTPPPAAAGRWRGPPDLPAAANRPASARRRREPACAVARGWPAGRRPGAPRRRRAPPWRPASSLRRRAGRTPARPALPAARRPGRAAAPRAADCAGSRSAAASRQPRCGPRGPPSRRGR